MRSLCRSDESAIVAYSADRKTAGVFAEMAFPVTKALELIGSVRYDKYSDFGNTTNPKVSLRWTPEEGYFLLDRHLERLRESAKKPRPNRDQEIAELAALEPLLATLEISSTRR